MKIFDIQIDNVSRKEILARVETFLDEPKFHRIATVNPEFLLEAKKNPDFQRALLEADMRVADGFGIVLAGWLHGKKIKRFAGTDLMEEILKIANEQKLSIFLAIRKDGLSSYEEIKSALLKKYSQMMVYGDNIDVKNLENYQLPTINCPLVFCNFGAPTQELFLANLKNFSENVRLAMGIGGALDYLTGKQKRAPKWLRFIGLEWLWRLILQPKRFKRIWNATVIFPFRVIFATIQK